MSEAPAVPSRWWTPPQRVRQAGRGPGEPGPTEQVVDLAAVLARSPAAVATGLLERMSTVLLALGHAAPVRREEARPAVERALAAAGTAQVWLALAVLTGRLPLAEDVLEAHRRLELDGPSLALGTAVAQALSASSPRGLAPVEVVGDAFVVDLHHTSQTDLATGIQRVSRETAQRWQRDHEVLLLGWTQDYTALRLLPAAARRRALGEPARSDEEPASDECGKQVPVVVPWRSHYLIVELATEEPRTRRMQALAAYSGNRTGMVGHDCVPLMSSETAGEGMGGAFARLLAAVRHMDHVATVSEASAVEYRGWRAMLAGVGLPGPDITAVPLAAAAQEPSAQALEAARSRLLVGRLPMVLCVGSHEPRKNHLAVLHAAELLWRRGVRFSLVLVGGNAWKSERFTQVLDGLRDQGRPIESLSAVSEDMLWASYRLAHVLLFPSLSEGFGLPVAEALASGTPVITSRYGSMAEIAREGGALLVDPRDDAAIAAALERVLTEPGLRASLAEQTRSRPSRNWDDYAADVWRVLVEGADGNTGA